MDITDASFMSIFLRPFKNWEDIPWKTFGYSYIGFLGLPFLLPLILLGRAYTNIVELVVGEQIEFSKYAWTGYAGLYIILFGIPTGFLGSAVISFILGFYLDGYLLVATVFVFLVGLSLSLPMLYYMIGECGPLRALGRLSRFRNIINTGTESYKKAVLVTAISTVTFFCVSMALLVTVVGIIAIPLAFLWYFHICADVYHTMDIRYKQELTGGLN